MRNVFDVLYERGFIEQTTHENEIREMLDKKKITFYIGFDPTADSLTAGHFLTVMLMAHMQKHGHRPIALIGGGTAVIGDPTGKTEMRKMLSEDQIENNANSIKKQLSRIIDFSENQAIMVNNIDWLGKLNYIDFLRDIGVHFSVNRMLTAECYKSRYEKGLTFLEFNYMLLQSYDFLELNKKYNCELQLGGNDQWSNIIGGVELIRRKLQKPAFGMTIPLLTTSDGKKMGKTETGAVWLDPYKTSPYDFYQYWRNIEDSNVIKCLLLLTFLPMEEITVLSKLEGNEINRAKEILAYEITKIVHGKEEADKSRNATEALFGKSKKSDSIPTTCFDEKVIENGIDILTLLMEIKIITSKGEGRRLVQQGGISVNDIKITDYKYIINKDALREDGTILIRKGKKVYHQVKI